MTYIGFKSREHSSGSRTTRLLVALLSLSSSYVAIAQTNEPNEDKPPAVSTSFEELQLFADPFDAIRRGYVEDVTEAELFEMALKGMLTSLDPHSAYLTDDDYENLQESTEGQFTGLGIEIGYRGGFIAIVTPIDGSPAIDAGLKAGDVILKIDGTSTQGMSTSESSTYMRGRRAPQSHLKSAGPVKVSPLMWLSRAASSTYPACDRVSLTMATG